MKIYEYLEDFDSPELDEFSWREQMEEAVISYNEEYGTNFNKDSAIRNYKSWKRDKNPMLNENWENI